MEVQALEDLKKNPCFQSFLTRHAKFSTLTLVITSFYYYYYVLIMSSIFEGGWPFVMSVTVVFVKVYVYTKHAIFIDFLLKIHLYQSVRGVH